MTQMINLNYPPAINPEAFRIWDEALRSDRYQQGAGRLGSQQAVLRHPEQICDTDFDSPDSYTLVGDLKSCCLGVICEEAILHGIPVERKESLQFLVGEDVEVVVSYDGYQDFLPPSVREWLGLLPENPGLTFIDAEGVEHIDGASAFNDGDSTLDRPLTFTEIADAIKNTFKWEEADDQSASTA